MQAAFFRRNEQLHLVAEKQKPDLVVVVDRTESEDRRDLGGEFALAELDTSKQPRGAHIHKKHDSQLALFGEFLDIGHVHAGRNIPVDGSNFITWSIFANLFKIHAPTFENAVVLAREDRVHQPAGAQLDEANFFENFFGISRHVLLSKKCSRRRGKGSSFPKFKAPEHRRRFARRPSR